MCKWCKNKWEHTGEGHTSCWQQTTVTEESNVINLEDLRGNRDKAPLGCMMHYSENRMPAWTCFLHSLEASGTTRMVNWISIVLHHSHLTKHKLWEHFFKQAFREQIWWFRSKPVVRVNMISVIYSQYVKTIGFRQDCGQNYCLKEFQSF